MTDYKQVSRPYYPSEWGKSETWLVKRLGVLWDLAEKDPIKFTVGRFGIEQEELICTYPGIVSILVGMRCGRKSRMRMNITRR